MIDAHIDTIFVIITSLEGFAISLDNASSPMHYSLPFCRKKARKASEQRAQPQSAHPPFWIPVFSMLPGTACPPLLGCKRIKHRHIQKGCSFGKDIQPA